MGEDALLGLTGERDGAADGTEHLHANFPDRPDLVEKLTPDFRPYSKRIVKDPASTRRSPVIT